MAHARTAGRQKGRAPLLQERSAGAVVFRRDGWPPFFLLLKYPAGHWDLPKGNIEEGEEPVDTTIREVREETGITDLEVIPGFKEEIEYFYRRDGKKVHKTVVFFLAETRTKEVTISFEHQAYGWFEFDEALKTVTYPNAKRLIKEGEEFIAAGLKRAG